MAKPTVVCVMGVGHSGSTILGIALGNHPQIETVGELHKLPRSGWIQDNSRRCSCGAPLFQCAYWREVYAHWIARVGDNRLQEYISLQNTFERSNAAWFHVVLDKWTHTAKFNQYSQMTAALYQSICDVSGKDVVVDTSKSPMRNYALLSSGALEFRLIHLVRDGRAIVWSKKRPRKTDIEGGIPHDVPSVPVRHTTQEWLFTNLKCEWVVRQAGAKHARRMLYEQFVKTPEVALQEIEPLIDKDLTEVAETLANGKMMQIGHLVGGNHVRMSGQITLRPDTEWTHHLSAEDRRSFWLIAGRLARRYGYAR
jgi:hypothetical protein